MSRILPALLLAFFLSTSLLSTGCSTYGDPDDEWRSFTGEVVWIPAGGRNGTWGIDARRFGKITPMEAIPVDFHRDGLVVSGELLLRPDAGSIRRWGKTAQIRNLQVVE